MTDQSPDVDTLNDATDRPRARARSRRPRKKPLFIRMWTEPKQPGAANAEPKGITWLLVSLARGMAFFLGTYAALSLLAAYITASYNPNSWWIDLGWLPRPAAAICQLLLATVLLAFSIKIPQRLFWRVAGVVTCAFFAIAAYRDALVVAEVQAAGGVRLGFPVPFSIFIMLALLLLLLAILLGNRAVFKHLKQSRSLATLALVMLSVALCGIAFPLGQIFCFGFSDYRAPVDAAVVFGAQVYPNGRLSPSLSSRVDKGIELYKQGYTPILIMSGGTGVEDVNEAEAMRDYATAHGVPEGAIIIDDAGNNSELTVTHSLEIASDSRFRRIAAVSSFYHMPRIKMLYLSQGHDVLTVPTDGSEEGEAAFIAALREIPAWWYYWFKYVLAF